MIKRSKTLEKSGTYRRTEDHELNMLEGVALLVYKCADISDADVLVEIYNSAFYDDFVRYGQCPAYCRTRENMEQSVRDFPKTIVYDERQEAIPSA